MQKKEVHGQCITLQKNNFIVLNNFIINTIFIFLFYFFFFSLKPKRKHKMSVYMRTEDLAPATISPNV